MLLIVVHLAAAVDPGFGWITWGAVLAATPARRRADDRADPGRDRADRGPRLARSGPRRCSAWTSSSRSPARRWRSSARILWIERPEATPLLLIPILIAFVGYRAYVQERQGHEKVKFLYEANRTLSESPEVAVALEGLLERALEAFHAEQAEVILFAADGGAPLRTGLGPGSAREAMAPVDAAAAAALRTLRRELRRRGRADGAVPGGARRLPRASAASATACSACCAARIA